MDFLKDNLSKVSGQREGEGQQHGTEKKEGGGGGLGGMLSGIGDKLNSAAGGGKDSEKNEDYLDKGTSFIFEVGSALACVWWGFRGVERLQGWVGW